jgi:exodeoxyribonuclease-3
MRIATWNVNSLEARLEKVLWWIDRAQPDVLLFQETKLTDEAAPYDVFHAHGFELAHHGQGRWNGVAIASRAGLSDVVTNFGRPLASAATSGSDGDALLSEARMIAARIGDLHVVSVYVPNGRALDSPFYERKLAWLAHLERWLSEHCDPTEPWLVAGDMNIAPTDADVWDPVACQGGTHVSAREREAFARLLAWGLVDLYRTHHPEPGRYTWWDYRAGAFHQNFGMRIDHMLATRPLAARVVGADIDREARKGKPTPSDHAPVWIDVDEPGKPVDSGWAEADRRIAARRARGSP